MKNKKFLLIPSLAITALLVASPIGITWASGDQSEGGMMNGMMMEDGKNEMMDAMNSPEGEKMMNACQDFMSSNNTEESD
ncbi:hypothetical protein HUG15_02020 [Salicibibacter cibarius]|uniref:FAD/FMN-containing dehydrogenase n=3 Tax=Bacillales TaxID=1385 RepID=A0A514LJD5_9BACI|nr:MULTISPECIES: hypothetical protein [Bacillales]MBB6449789.1 hypothetical protein [Geomicrobium halophilum]QDI91966.1 hypothetical protein EPH95_12920 [Salicibibacter halophilus]QQK74500.1 hypothetical protein HUG15_02020 [Salicibibacter cibarius]